MRGIGVHAVCALHKRGGFPAGTEVLEVGTAVLDALPYLETADRVIIMDAMIADGQPGTVYRISYDDCQRPQTISSLHGFDLSRVLALAGRCDRPEVIVFGVEPGRIEWSLELSEPVAAALPALLAAVREEACQPTGDVGLRKGSEHVPCSAIKNS
jgi:hydrogenase maturation protease